MTQPTRLALCEATRLVLRIGRPYVFHPVDGCAECERLATAARSAYGPDEVEDPAPTLQPDEIEFLMSLCLDAQARAERVPTGPWKLAIRNRPDRIAELWGKLLHLTQP